MHCFATGLDTGCDARQAFLPFGVALAVQSTSAEVKSFDFQIFLSSSFGRKSEIEPAPSGAPPARKRSVSCENPVWKTTPARHSPEAA
ncbi:hypothetical protein M707_16265 [Arthrobacter sp. AK-YN10]|nr:hypothetical protein M707_16265 [Arthrobacter sp. AK-YN10]